MVGEIADRPDLSQAAPEPKLRPAAAAKSPDDDAAQDVAGRELRVAAYGGLPYTHRSDVHIVKPGATDLTVHDVGWDGRPLKSPIYYGIRALAWSVASAFGAMVDFTHSKAIARRDDVVRFSGSRDGKAGDEKAAIGARFRHLEFSHGHNMLTLNGLLRFATLSNRVVPYVGLGAGLNLPHTEVQFVDDAVRTYMYQFAGYTGQAVAGVEVRIAGLALFFEYKLTVSPYTAPLYDRTTPSTWYGWGITDFPYQLARWWNGRAPEGGVLTTDLISHQLIGGVSGRVAGGAPAAAK
jgi:hypothetical protein